VILYSFLYSVLNLALSIYFNINVLEYWQHFATRNFVPCQDLRPVVDLHLNFTRHKNIHSCRQKKYTIHSQIYSDTCKAGPHFKSSREKVLRIFSTCGVSFAEADLLAKWGKSRVVRAPGALLWLWARRAPGSWCVARSRRQPRRRAPLLLIVSRLSNSPCGDQNEKGKVYSCAFSLSLSLFLGTGGAMEPTACPQPSSQYYLRTAAEKWKWSAHNTHIIGNLLAKGI